MDDVQIISANDNKEEKSGFKIFLIFFILIFLSIVVAGISYIMGRKYSEDTQSSQNQISPTETPGLVLPENTQTSTPTVTIKPTLTTKPTFTPTPPPTSTPTPSPILKTKIISSISTLDGFRSSNGGGNSALEIRAGRNSNLVTRGFVSFEITEIPSDAIIQNALLRLYQAKIIGNPYGSGGILKVDHLTYGDTLDSSDYALPALTANFINLSINQTLGWKEADVTERLKDDTANARSVSQYRIHFQNEIVGGDVSGDFAYFEAKEGTLSTGNTPQLVVKYY